MSYQFHRPQVMDCPSCGATLAVPDAETFVCDYCGKRIVIPPASDPLKLLPISKPPRDTRML